jgi:hypothetical protein
LKLLKLHTNQIQRGLFKNVSGELPSEFIAACVYRVLRNHNVFNLQRYTPLETTLIVFPSPCRFIFNEVGQKFCIVM